MALRPRCWVAVVAAAALPLMTEAAGAETAVQVVRGKEQKLHLYGPADGRPVVLWSGDGGFVHLAPEVAGFLGTEGFRVVVDRARGKDGQRVLLVGVSEGAGLSVVAAADPAARATTLRSSGGSLSPPSTPRTTSSRRSTT